MSDVTDRDKKERKLARELSRVLGDHFEEVMDLLGDPPNFNNLPMEYWARFNADISAVLSAQLNEIFYEQFLTALEGFGLSVDMGHGSDQALAFVQRYTFDLVSGIEETTRAALRKEIDAFIRDGGMRIDDLANRLNRWYSPVRAEMIAITEVTRAAVQGELETVADIARDSDLQFVPYWQTANDEIVRRCPICWPKNDKPITDGNFPPAHPRCRCWVNHKVTMPEEEE